MPKTRNVTRSQWDTANNTTSTSTTRKTTSRKRNENENNGCESEKENAGRQGPNATRLHSRARTRAGLLGTSNANVAVLGATTASNSKVEKVVKGKTASKGKGVPPSAPLKRKKMPLQDITAEFLPAPEAANRGESAQEETAGDDAPSGEGATNVVVATAPLPETISAVALPPARTYSPLPPSSPPSELTQSPILHPEPSALQFHDDFDISSNHSIPQATFDPWQEYDDANPLSQEANPLSQDEPRNVSSNSDPFGFVALERKLKADREAAVLMAPDRDFEDAEQVFEADTSSPRPVRRLKRSSFVEEEAEVTELVIPHPHFVTPPTPHKDQHKRRRISHPGHNIFSPCSSSIESSPSPTKASSARKRAVPDMAEDPLDEYNEEIDRSYAVELASKKAKVDEGEESDAKKEGHSSAIHLEDSILRSLRPREKRRSTEEVRSDDEVGNKRLKKAIKTQNAKKPSSKPRSVPAKDKGKDEASDDEEDLDAKWQREREARIEYFKRLEDYQVEKEDVFLI